MSPTAVAQKKKKKKTTTTMTKAIDRQTSYDLGDGEACW
jgi:hypothetical protein